MSDKESKIEKAGYNFGKNVLGPILWGIVIIFVFAFPVWTTWNSTIYDIFPMLGPIAYPKAFCLCVMVWSFGRVWKGVPDGKN